MINVEIIMPDRIKLERKCDHLVIPGIDGDFGVYEGHTPMLTQIRPGVLHISYGGKEENYAIHDGFVTVENDHVLILSERVESASEIDFKRAEEARERAEKRLKESSGDIDFRRAELAMRRAVTRLNIKKH
ncbi:MAG: F0F1 ATP synthase subunit epsilon [Candidatus Cloacimonetes bacterium]|nr:F0F1 ATP synthase subunit epsilon [Candidatus Cloacimonadota bacterium]